MKKKYTKKRPQLIKPITIKQASTNEQKLYVTVWFLCKS